MVWNNVNISKAELEKKQREYSRMAMEMAKRAQKSEHAAKAATASPTAAKSAINAPVHEAKSVPAAQVLPAKAEIPAVKAEKAEKAEINPAVQSEEQKSEATAQAVSAKAEARTEKAAPAVKTEQKEISTNVHTEVTKSEVAEAASDKAEPVAEVLFDSIPTDIFVKEETADHSDNDAVAVEKNTDAKADMSEKSSAAEPTEAVQAAVLLETEKAMESISENIAENTAEKTVETIAKATANSNAKTKAESTSADTTISADKTPEAIPTGVSSDSGEADEECIDVSEEDPQKLFDSIFITEEQADEKIEKLKKEKESTVKKAPDFNSYIQNHNRSMSSCNCENCRKKREAAKHIQEKGGQKGTSY